MCRRLIRKMSAEWDAMWQSQCDQFQIRVLQRGRRILATSSSRRRAIDGGDADAREGRALVGTKQPTQLEMRGIARSHSTHLVVLGVFMPTFGQA